MNVTMSTIDDCYRIAREELKRITCYDIPTEVQRVNIRHYISDDGSIYEEEVGDRGAVYNTKIGTKHDLITRLIWQSVRDFAFDYELRHRRRFEDNRRQVNEIIVRCYGYLGDKYEYTLMSNLRDNADISFQLLEHYIKVCRILLSKTSIPEPTMRRIRFIAYKEYVGPMGGMHDVAFALDYVRYNVDEIIKVLPVTEDQFMQYEEQYERLVRLERERQNQMGKYPLALWDNEVFGEAEEILKGKRFVDGAALQCALYLLINAIHHDRAVGLDINLCFREEAARKKYRPLLSAVFLEDKYCMYHFGPSRNFDEGRKSSLSFKTLGVDTGGLNNESE